MKTVCLLAVVAALLLTAGVSAQTVKVDAPPAATSATPAVTSSGMALFKSDKERIGYIMGTGIGHQMKRQGLQAGDFDPNFVGKGIADTLADKVVLTDEEARQVMMAFQADMQAKLAERNKVEMEKAKVEGEKNKTEGDKFLADNKAKDGVKTLPSGLQYKVIKDGTGEIPTAADSVTVNYSGKFLDGTEFDSSYKRGQPANFPVGRVIPAWTEILQKMKVGSKYEIWVPGALGYGEQGNPPRIPPNATLHFEIELLSIDKAAK